MNKGTFGSFDYMTAMVEESMLSQYINGYEKFGWTADENRKTEINSGKVIIYMKRARCIANKTELIRLQRHFESCMEEISTLENSKNSVPTLASISCGLLGCVLMVASVFEMAALHPIIPLMIAFAVPGFILWVAAYLSYKPVKRKRIEKVLPFIKAKYDEAFEVCQNAFALAS